MTWLISALLALFLAAAHAALSSQVREFRCLPSASDVVWQIIGSRTVVERNG